MCLWLMYFSLALLLYCESLLKVPFSVEVPVPFETSSSVEVPVSFEGSFSVKVLFSVEVSFSLGLASLRNFHFK